MDIFMLVMKEELTPLFILKYLKFLMGDRVFFFFCGLLDRNQKTAEEK